MTDRQGSTSRADSRKAVPAYRQRLQEIVSTEDEAVQAPVASKGIHPEGLPPEHIRRNHRPRQWRDPRLSEEIRLAPRRPGWQQMLATFGIIVAAYAILIALDPPASIVDGSPYEKFNEYIALGIMCLLVWVRWLFHSQTRRDDRPPPD